MTATLRLLRLLTMVLWVGGLIFFAFIEAPTAFKVMGTTQAFAMLIGSSILSLNRLGYTCGFIFVLASITLWARTEPRVRRFLLAQIPVVAVMIAATLYVQRHIVPAMDRDRIAAGGDINAVAKDSPVRVDFDRLHAASEKVEGTALLLGLVVVILMSLEQTDTCAPRQL